MSAFKDSIEVECRMTVSDETAAGAVVLLNMYLAEGEHKAYVWDRPDGTQKIEVLRRSADE